MECMKSMLVWVTTLGMQSQKSSSQIIRKQCSQLGELEHWDYLIQFFNVLTCRSLQLKHSLMWHLWVVIDWISLRTFAKQFGGAVDHVEALIEANPDLNPKYKYSGMLKSERPVTEQRRNPNEMVSHSQTVRISVRSNKKAASLDRFIYIN